jgi:hypothetical protein
MSLFHMLVVLRAGRRRKRPPHLREVVPTHPDGCTENVQMANFIRRLNNIASDPRWWVAILLVFIVAITAWRVWSQL